MLFLSDISCDFADYPSEGKIIDHSLGKQESTRENFRAAFEQLGQADSIDAVHEAIFNFFNHEFHLPPRALTMQSKTELSDVQRIINRFLQCTASNYSDRHRKILVFDELAFTVFYHANSNEQLLLNFLQDLESDIFIPIYHHQTVVGYITIALGSRQHDTYSASEKNRMAIFATFLGNITAALQRNRRGLFIQQENLLENELYLRHREIRLYHESLKSSLQDQQKKEPTIILYKKGKFAVLTDTTTPWLSKERPDGTTIIQGKQFMHRWCASLMEKFEQITSANLIESGTQETLLISDTKQQDQRKAIAIIQADITNVMACHQLYLRNDEDILYLFYLEKTALGKQIHKLLPGIAPTLIEIRVMILKALIQRNSFFIQADPADIGLLLSLFDYANPEKKFQVIELDEIIMKAIHQKDGHPTFNYQKAYNALKTICFKGGNFFIKKIQHVDLVIQKALLKFVDLSFSGTTAPYMPIRILIFDKQHPTVLHQEGILLEGLFNIFKDHTITLPRPSTLDKDNLGALIEGLSSQISKHPFILTRHDKEQLITNAPESMRELYRIIAAQIKQKMKSEHTVNSHPLIKQSDRESNLMYLDQHALKEPKTVQALWDKFGNCYKIAAFLGVHPSSVFRRCKQFGIIKPRNTTNRRPRI